MSDSNEKLVDIQQTLREGNKLAEIQKSLALQRAEFDRTLKTGGGLSSFLDRGDKYGKIGDIYSAQFGLQSGIFKGQGAIELLRSYMGAGGQAGDPGVSKLLGTAKEQRALDIIETQKDLNRAFEGSGLKLGVPSLAEARKQAETQIAAELKTGDSDMERQMAGLERALSGALNSSMGGQMNDAAQTFATVLAGSNTFQKLNGALEKNTQVLMGLDAALKAMKVGVTSEVISSTRAGGNIPISAAATEKMMAKAGGYNPGYVRRAGNLIYNSAERVSYLPGVREPVISPPPGSLAGFLHRQSLNNLEFSALGDDPFDIWKTKQEELRQRRRARAAISFRNKGRFARFPKPDLTTVGGMQQVSGRSVPLPQIVPSVIPKVIGVANYGEFPEIKPSAGTSPIIKPPSYLGYPNVGASASGLSQLERQYVPPAENIAIRTPVPQIDLPIQGGIQKSYVAPDGRIITTPLAANPDIIAGLSGISRPYVDPGVTRIQSIISPQERRANALKGLPRPSRAPAFSVFSPGFDDPLDLINYQNRGKGIIPSNYSNYANQSKLIEEILSQSKPLPKDFIGPVQPSGMGLGPSGRQLVPRSFGQDLKNLIPSMSGNRVGQFLSSTAKTVSPYARAVGTGAGAALGGFGLGFGLGELGTSLLTKNYKQAGEAALGVGVSGAGIAGLMGVGGAAMGPLAIVGGTGLALRQAGKEYQSMSQAKYGEQQSVLDLEISEKLRRTRYGLKGGREGKIGVLASQLSEAGKSQEARDLISKFNTTRNAQESALNATKAYQSTSGTRFQQEQFALTQGMSPAERVTYFKQQMTGKYGQWGSQEDYQAGLSRASTDVNRDTLAKRYNITAPGQLDRLHTGLTKAAELGKTKEYVAQLERLYRGVVQPAQKPATAKPEETAGGDKTKLDINVTMGGNLGIKNTSVEFSEEQYMVINSMIAAVSEGIEKKIKAITDKLPAETRSNVANATPPQAGPSRATPYGV